MIWFPRVGEAYFAQESTYHTQRADNIKMASRLASARMEIERGQGCWIAEIACLEFGYPQFEQI